MKTTFTADGTLQADDGGGRLIGKAAIIVGGAGAHNSFGGGTLNIQRKLADGNFKTIQSYTAVNTQPDILDGIGNTEIRAVLTGSTTPDLYVEISQI